MSLFPRLLGPITVAVAFAASASPALADPIATFPATTVEITDPGAASPTVHLTVTAADPADLAKTHVFLGGDTFTPYTAIGVDGVRDARYAAADDTDVDGELSTDTCAVYNGSELQAPVDVAEDGASFSAELPKGEVISFEDTGVDVGIEGVDTACSNQGFDGLEVDYVNHDQQIDGFTWSAPAAPVITHVTGGRRQVALSFDQEPGTQYDIYRVGEDTPFASNIRGNGDDVQVVLTEDADGNGLTPGTEYKFQVKATRLFHIWGDDGMYEPTSELGAMAGATTAAVQVVTFTGAPAASTTDRNARFSWSISGNDAGEAPWCGLDLSEFSGTEVPCTATGAAIDGVSVGAHTLTVFPADGEEAYSRSWTVTAAPAAPAAPVVAPLAPAAKPAVTADPDGDGITNTWLIAGKPAPSPVAPKASVSGGNVKLKLGKPVKNAKKVRVFRASGKGAYKLVKTLGSKTAAFTDRSVKRGVTYSYKTVAVNAKGQQSKASAKTVVKVKKP